MSRDSEEWQELFDQGFAALKEKFRPANVTKLPPDVATFWRTIQALPCAVKIVDLKIDQTRRQLIRFDFSRFNDNSVEYIGEINVADTSSLEEVLISKLDVNPRNAKDTAREISHEFRPSVFWYDEEPQFYYIVTSHDIRGNLVDELITLFQMPLPESAFEKFRVPEIDFAALYDLETDRIRSIEENIDARRRAYPQVSFEDLQRSIAGIQLIPRVPENVHQVFKYAKDMHIFGYFRYSFFTISHHYAFLALESAIKHRYIESLDGKAILRNKKKQTHEMTKPTYQGIQDYCYRNRESGWDIKKLVVNEERFPCTMHKLLNWLLDHELITTWEKTWYKAGIDLRNSLSHLENPSIFTPSSMVLSQVAYGVNKLFHN